MQNEGGCMLNICSICYVLYVVVKVKNSTNVHKKIVQQNFGKLAAKKCMKLFIIYDFMKKEGNIQKNML